MIRLVEAHGDDIYVRATCSAMAWSRLSLTMSSEATMTVFPGQLLPIHSA